MKLYRVGLSGKSLGGLVKSSFDSLNAQLIIQKNGKTIISANAVMSMYFNIVVMLIFLTFIPYLPTSDSLLSSV